ncbi:MULTISPECIES: hypothetical protein [Pseudomonas]|uniref:hypothetical protein n=1 Tax=Pseudomonas TaxID=286 RepID=UPI001FAE0B08|nr:MULTISPECIES: hypothetical protein [Pseudomonas]
MIDILRLLKRSHIGAEPKEADRLQKRLCVNLILNIQPAVLEQLKLVANVNGGFAECPHAQKIPGKKNPHNLCLVAKATRGMAGVLLQRLGSRPIFCKGVERSAMIETVWKSMQIDGPGRLRRRAFSMHPLLLS